MQIPAWIVDRAKVIVQQIRQHVTTTQGDASEASWRRTYERYDANRDGALTEPEVAAFLAGAGVQDAPDVARGLYSGHGGQPISWPKFRDTIMVSANSPAVIDQRAAALEAGGDDSSMAWIAVALVGLGGLFLFARR